MGKEIDLLKNYPRVKRNVDERGSTKTEEDRQIARKFGKDFFDGSRKHGYGGYYYNPRFWQNVIPDFVKQYNLTANSKILDIGCGKGFMLYDFYKLLPGIAIKGIDISSYAIENSVEEIKSYLMVGNAAEKLPFSDKSFDLVISINTVHNLENEDLKLALQEIDRVGKNSFITVDAYKNDEEKEQMYKWNLTAKTILHVDEWKKYFKKVGYFGDYYWFMP